jgi:hypothetical protein
VARFQQAGTEVRTDEAGTAGDQDARVRHQWVPD